MKYFKSILVLLLLAGLAQTSYSQTPVFTNDQQVAINGYDAVAYFNQHEAVRGSNEHTATVDGATYYFSSAANAAAFKANPSAYQPAYGGYCAFAVAMKAGNVPSDPQTFKIRDGKLYLFYNDFYEGKPFNAIVPWNGKESEMISQAEANWKK